MTSQETSKQTEQEPDKNSDQQYNKGRTKVTNPAMINNKMNTPQNNSTTNRRTKRNRTPATQTPNVAGKHTFQILVRAKSMKAKQNYTKDNASNNNNRKEGYGEVGKLFSFSSAFCYFPYMLFCLWFSFSLILSSCFSVFLSSCLSSCLSVNRN